jgi:hypothetical protein
MVQVNNENPNEHWQFVDVKDRVVVDLGCGRWEHIEYRDPEWPTTPEYWIQQGASSVIGIDADLNEIRWFEDQLPESEFKFSCNYINSIESMQHVIETYSPNCIKCDIEGGEVFLFNLPDEIFCLVDEYYIETHGDEMYNMCLNKLESCNYEIREQIDLIHTSGFCKVIFGKKQ